jgi:hypothetical protein
MEIRHALVVMAIPVGIAFVLRVLALKGFIAAPELEPVPFSAHKAWRVVGNLAVWGSVPLGALIAKGIRLRRLAGIRREGLRPCKRCEYAMEISATVCPICGQVV